jgi:peptidoglycan/LPS O-acetylase OafA/YrhL
LAYGQVATGSNLQHDVLGRACNIFTTNAEIGNLEKREYIPAFDGLRAIAVIGVLLFHLGGTTFSVGWTGVILFFVLSGYLITGILLDAKGSDGYFRNFYARRALRIFPAYYLTLLLTAVTIFIVAPGSPALGPGAFEWTYFIFYVQNYWMGIEAYKTPLSGILGHTWTLAIEEQFYLIWPAAVFFLGRRALIGFCIALLVLSPIVRIWILQSTGNPALTLATLPGQCDALALGALIAVLERTPTVMRWINARASTYFYPDTFRKRWSAYLVVLSFIPLFAIVAATGWSAYASPYIWLNAPGNFAFITLLSLFFAALLLLGLNEATPLAKLLGSRFMTHIGRISYGIYLYHMLTFYFCDQLMIKLAPLMGKGLSLYLTGAALKFTVTYVVALLSYRYVELPFLQLKSKFAGPRQEAKLAF